MGRQNPPPPPSSTKSHRLFGKGGLGELPAVLALQPIASIVIAVSFERGTHCWVVNRRSRTCSAAQHGRRLRARPGKETVAARQDGEERHAKPRTGGQGTDGGCRTFLAPRTRPRVDHWLRLHSYSNNCPSGARPATRMSRTSQTSWVFFSTRSASSRINTSIDTTSTASR